jgi:hypothetical protein
MFKYFIVYLELIVFILLLTGKNFEIDSYILKIILI